MASSSGVPRNMEFLFSPIRCRTVEHMRLANALCVRVEFAQSAE